MSLLSSAIIFYFAPPNRIPVCLSVCLPVWLPVCLAGCLSVYLSLIIDLTEAWKAKSNVIGGEEERVIIGGEEEERDMKQYNHVLAAIGEMTLVQLQVPTQEGFFNCGICTYLNLTDFFKEFVKDNTLTALLHQ